jgi:plasmid stability protein
VETRNITFSLPEDLIRLAKVFAAEHDTTVNAVVRELLQEALAPEKRTQRAAGRLLALAEDGPYFTGEPSAVTRDELHERR